MAAIADRLSGTDVCMACQDCLADVLQMRCGHRVLCQNCMQRLTANARRSGRRPVCPTCREEIHEGAVQPCRDLQLETTEPRDADMQDGVFPYAALLDFRRSNDSENGVESADTEMDWSSPIRFADTQTMQNVREAVLACSQGRVPIHELRAALGAQLTTAERELAFVELNKHVDLHQTLLGLDDALLRRDGVWGEVARQIIRRTVEGQDSKAMAGRAAVSVAGDVVGLLAAGANSVKQLSASNFITNGIVLLILSSVDLYRWSKGDISAAQLACNIGEHVAGCGAALGGAIGGAAVGAAVGGPLAPITSILGALVGGFLADFIARKGYQCAVNAASGALKVEETEDEARQRALRDAAVYLGIDLQRDGFALAKSKFRRMILESHPDRARSDNSEEDNKKAGRIIAAWQIVRGHYEARDELDDGDGRKEPEAFVSIMVMRTRQTINDTWKVARTWFGEMQNSPVHTGQLEMVERYNVYL